MRWSKTNLQNAIENSTTYKDILIKLDLVPTSNAYYRLKRYLNEYELSFEPDKYKLKEKWEKNNIMKNIKKSSTQSETLINIGLSNGTGNVRTLNKYIMLYDIDISHFTNNKQHNILNRNIYKYNISDILVENSTYSGDLKDRLYKEGLKERVCVECGQDENWRGNKFSLILDHINGINNDNRLENLRIVCPNCNAALPTHCRGNLKRLEKKQKEKETYKIRNYCKCGKEIIADSKNCQECDKFSRRKVERPLYEQLLNEIKDVGFTNTGKKYNVSDTSVKKWLINYEIELNITEPYKKNKNYILSGKYSKDNLNFCACGKKIKASSKKCRECDKKLRLKV